MLQGSISMISQYRGWKGRLDWETENGYIYVTMVTWTTDGNYHQGNYDYELDYRPSFTAIISIDGVSKKFYYEVQTPEKTIGSLSAKISGDTVAVSGCVIPPYGSAMYPGKDEEMPLTGEETIDLNPKPKVNPSPVSASPNPVVMGKNVAIVMDREQAGVKHTLAYRFGSRSGTIATNVDGSYAWTVPDMADACGDATSGTCTITCTTFFEGENFGSTSCEITLNVPDATQVSASDGTLGTDMVVSIDPKSANFTHDILCEFKGVTVSIANGAKENVRWIPPYDLAKEIPSLTYGTATLKCTTKNGTAVVGETSKTIRLTVPDNDATKPKITDVVLSPKSAFEGRLGQLYIDGKSGLQADITAESAYSEIASYEMKVGNRKATGNPAVINYLQGNIGLAPVYITVTDKRGFQGTWSEEIPVEPYNKPRVCPISKYDEVICERALSTGELNDNGTYLAIMASRSYQIIYEDGEHLNKCTLRYRYRVSGASEYGDWETLIGPEEPPRAEVKVLISDVVASTSTSYDVELSAVDTIGEEHVISFQISTSSISFVLYDGEDGAGFGKYPESPNTVDIAKHMTLIVRGKMIVIGDGWVNLGLRSNVSPPSEDVGRAPGTGCYYRAATEDHIYVAFNFSYDYHDKYSTFISDGVIPEKYCPKNPVYSLCPANNRLIALVSVQTNGRVMLEWVQSFGDTVDTSDASITWIDGYIDYWI